MKDDLILTQDQEFEARVLNAKYLSDLDRITKTHYSVPKEKEIELLEVHNNWQKEFACILDINQMQRFESWLINPSEF